MSGFTAHNADRMPYLDGLRGLAILIVVLFHAYVRWSSILPFGASFEDVAIISNGFLGVQLFFMISGFVIFMSLDRSADLLDFAWRRWLRLFPAMLLCSLVIYISAPLMPERPAGPAPASQLIPGLTFIDPVWWKLVGFDLRAIDGAFWSLFVEVQFYAIAGAIYFCVGRTIALATIIGVFAFTLAPSLLVWFSLQPTSVPGLVSSVKFVTAIGCGQYGWFGAGILLYQFTRDNSVAALLGAFCLILISAGLQPNWDFETKAWAISLGMLFISAVCFPIMQRVLSIPPLLFLGAVSYPLYLCHQNIVAALTIKIGNWVPDLPYVLMPFPPMLLVVTIAWLVAKYGEPDLKRRLLARADKFTRGITQVRALRS